MDPMAQGPRRRTARQSPPQATPPPTPAFERAAALVRVMGSAADLEQWERMLTVLAVHSDGAGFERAQLMLWEPRTELLSARLPARGTDGSMPLGAALDRARIPQSTTMLADVGSLARAPSWSTAELAGPAAAAWHRGECAIAPAEVKGAWPGHPEVGAAPVRRGGRPFGIIVGEWPSIGEPGERLAGELKEHVANKIGPIARPEEVLFSADLPKTRSGKIMRRLLRDIAEGRTLGDTTTLADPAVVESLKRKYEEEGRG